MLAVSRRMRQKKWRKPSHVTGMDKKARTFCVSSASKAQKPSTCCTPPALQQIPCLPSFSTQKLRSAPSAAQASQLVTDLDDERFEPQKPSHSLQPISMPTWIRMTRWIFRPFQDILTNIPTPNPEPATTHDFRLPRKKEIFDPNETRVSAPLSNASVFKREASPAVHLNKLPVTTKQAKVRKRSLQSPQTVFDQVEVTAPSRPKPRPETPVARPAPGETGCDPRKPHHRSRAQTRGGTNHSGFISSDLCMSAGAAFFISLHHRRSGRPSR